MAAGTHFSEVEELLVTEFIDRWGIVPTPSNIVQPCHPFFLLLSNIHFSLGWISTQLRLHMRARIPIEEEQPIINKRHESDAVSRPLLFFFFFLWISVKAYEVNRLLAIIFVHSPADSAAAPYSQLGAIPRRNHLEALSRPIGDKGNTAMHSLRHRILSYLLYGQSHSFSPLLLATQLRA